MSSTSASPSVSGDRGLLALLLGGAWPGGAVTAIAVLVRPGAAEHARCALAAPGAERAARRPVQMGYIPKCLLSNPRASQAGRPEPSRLAPAGQSNRIHCTVVTGTISHVSPRRSAAARPRPDGHRQRGQRGSQRVLTTRSITRVCPGVRACVCVRAARGGAGRAAAWAGTSTLDQSSHRSVRGPAGRVMPCPGRRDTDISPGRGRGARIAAK